MNSELLSVPFAIMGLGSTELIILLVIILLLFGGAKLPSLARGLGQSIKEFKKAANNDDDQSKSTAAPTASEPAKKQETTKTHGSN